MRALVEQAMRDGAFGLSTGLFYVPGNYTPTAEVVELARVAGRMGGLVKIEGEVTADGRRVASGSLTLAAAPEREDRR